ncbi:Hypothetical_protein [Hexamita inflata]|uniref:Hypothetical_protein n=1 Tax=Hexamita inflata TaxID=28002 RepID=A0AA86U4W0_9EUKA|nr:Hypothetical protein HINF_LOCUS30375 [Hexamita inflata]
MLLLTQLLQCSGFLVNGSCTECDTSKFYQPSKINGFCQCQEFYYDYNGQCSQCDPKYFKPTMENDWCVCTGVSPNIYLQYFGYSCSLCDEMNGQQEVNGSCTCKVNYELTNSDPLVCTECDPKSSFVNGSCVCNSGYVKNGFQCEVLNKKITSKVFMGIFVVAIVVMTLVICYLQRKIRHLQYRKRRVVWNDQHMNVYHFQVETVQNEQNENNNNNVKINREEVHHYKKQQNGPKKLKTPENSFVKVKETHNKKWNPVITSIGVDQKMIWSTAVEYI